MNTPDLVRPSRAAIAAATVTVVLWASAFVGIRAAAPHFSPGSLALGRLLAGAVTLLIFLLISRQGLPPRAAWPGIVVSGVIWFGIYMVALNWGEQLVDAGTAAMLVNVGPA
jgi:drug/metabolite transporter (DMT)-like permease